MLEENKRMMGKIISTVINDTFTMLIAKITWLFKIPELAFEGL